MKAPDFWQTRGAVSTLLAPLGELYALGGLLRRKLATPVRVSVPVICVGNLVAGGTGKTPVALALVDILQKNGKKPHFLTRGYGGRERGPLQVSLAEHTADQVGDEALLLARAAPCWVARDRAEGARAAIRHGADILIMDDGFQNPSLVKDLSLLVVDGETGFGNGRLIPAGPLRETVEQGIRRADGVVVMGEDRTGIATHLGKLPILRASLAAEVSAYEKFFGRSVIAFAGIGRPEKFFAMLRAHGVMLSETKAFADHHPYQKGDILPLLERAEQQNAMVVTTEKDKVRLPVSVRSRIHSIAVSVLWEDPSAVQTLLEHVGVHE